MPLVEISPDLLDKIAAERAFIEEQAALFIDLALSKAKAN